MGRQGAETGGMWPAATECPGYQRPHPEAGKGRKDPPGGLRGRWPCDTLVSHSGLWPEREELPEAVSFPGW